MKINKITLSNFRQYYGSNSISLTTDQNKNIILIGGKNGYGKTNFLISLVWCLYGEDIVKIDENFKREIQKEGNYAKFLKASINRDALSEGANEFSVEIELSDIELPDTLSSSQTGEYTCIIKRTCNLATVQDDLMVTVYGVNFKKEIEEPLDKTDFINDYLVPIEAAKFVFFDAEKIANMAELSAKEEGSVMNDALSRLLGLDVYTCLIDDLNIYCDNLKKESASESDKISITSTENTIKINTERIEKIEEDVIRIDSSVEETKIKIDSYDKYLAALGSKESSQFDLTSLNLRKKQLLDSEKNLEEEFNSLFELIPFCIAAGKVEELNEHIEKQTNNKDVSSKIKDLENRNEELIERLFNKPPHPTDGDISLGKKMFFADKAKKILNELYKNEETKINEDELNFEHDITKADKDLVGEIYNRIKNQTKEVFEQTVNQYNIVKNEITELDKTIAKIESDLEDEEIIEYTTKKKDAERKNEKYIEDKGALLFQKDNLKKENEKLLQKYHFLLKKIDVSTHKKNKLVIATSYLKTLESFVYNQKSKKCRGLETLMFNELKKLMHKLQSNNADNFIAGVKVEPLPDNDGLKITLLDKDGNTRHKESLSQGEKQLYISSLIKAIMTQSIQEFPIFIDTPLGRLDDEHIKHVLLYYYPDLASQVVIMATNNEIPPSRYKLIKDNVSLTYLLENKENRTSFKQSYFQGYEN